MSRKMASIKRKTIWHYARHKMTRCYNDDIELRNANQRKYKKLQYANRINTLIKTRQQKLLGWICYIRPPDVLPTEERKRGKMSYSSTCLLMMAARDEA